MKTILHLIETSGPGGAEKVLISLVENLNSRQYRSIIFLLKDGWLRSRLNVGGNSELVLEGETGFLVPPKDPGSLAVKLLTLLENETLRKRFGDLGMLRIQREFSVDAMVKQYEKLYELKTTQSEAKDSL